MIPFVLALGGYSESGKSSSARYLSTRGFARIKIAALYKRIYERVDTDLGFVAWSSWIDTENPEWIGERFVDELRAEAQRRSADRCTIESLYGDTLARELKRHFGDRFKVVFIDLDHGTRLKRQMEREGLSTIDEARAMMEPRDEMKRRWGADRVRTLADIVLRNDGAISDLHLKLDGLVASFA
ncbi:MAG: hypothetical protein CVT81_11030 [Alphaproteobacteria bacterium HGW-Alphaproteobacteria-3]|nr:MAG: hypothetical protein CVT81_11030 [Alphaproteobacteria bacterium HGW-Alphaproteobacteria-3]